MTSAMTLKAKMSDLACEKWRVLRKRFDFYDFRELVITNNNKLFTLYKVLVI